MGYHLTIIRRNDKPVDFNELAKEARLIGQCSVDETKQSISITIGDEVLYVHCINQVAFTENVTSKQIIKKLVLLAQALDGRLRGDEMETYRVDGTSFTHPDDSDELAVHDEEITKVVKRRKVIKIAKAVILAAILLVVALKFIGFI